MKNSPPSICWNPYGGTVNLDGASTKLIYLNCSLFFNDTQCCISNFTGWRSFFEKEKAYTALTSSVPSGNVNSPPTRAFKTISQVSDGEMVSCEKWIFNPYSSQFSDCGPFPTILNAVSLATMTFLRQWSVMYKERETFVMVLLC